MSGVTGSVTEIKKMTKKDVPMKLNRHYGFSTARGGGGGGGDSPGQAPHPQKGASLTRPLLRQSLKGSGSRQKRRRISKSLVGIEGSIIANPMKRQQVRPSLPGAPGGRPGPVLATPPSPPPPPPPSFDR